MEKEENTEFNRELFGKEILYYLDQETVTDVIWTGRDLRIEDLKYGPYVAKEKLDTHFVEELCQRLSDHNSRSFNSSVPFLAAFTSDLRISCLDKSRNSMGTRLAIRKTEAKNRIKDPIKSGYCHPAVYDCVKTFYQLERGSVNCGQTGSGKTEWSKYCVRFINPLRPIATIEDSYELRLSEIEEYNDYDIISIWVDEKFTWSDAIKKCLRQNAKWIMQAEAQGEEMKDGIFAAATGHGINTCIHTGHVREIKGRVKTMIGSDENAESLLNDFFTFFDFAVHIRCEVNSKGENERYIDELGIFNRDEENDKNEIIMIYENRKLTGNTIPENMLSMLKERNLPNPLEKYVTKDGVVL